MDFSYSTVLPRLRKGVEEWREYLRTKKPIGQRGRSESSILRQELEEDHKRSEAYIVLGAFHAVSQLGEAAYQEAIANGRL